MYNDYYQEEELMGSLSSFEEALEHNENKYFEIHEFEYIIDHYLGSGDISSSRKAIQKALLIHTKSHELQKRLAQLNNMEGFHESAIDILNTSFNSFGTDKDIDYYLILGESYLGIGEAKKAKLAFDKAIDLSEDEFFDIVTAVASLYQQEDYFEEVIFYLKSIEKDDSSLLFDIGLSYHNLLDYKNAILYFEKFIRLEPFSVDAWYYVSKSYQQNHQLQLAEEALLNTIAIDSSLIIYHYDLAKNYIDQSKFIEALDVYKEILSKDKNVNHSIFLSIGDISFNLEQYDNAKKNYEIALRLNPDSADAYYSLAQVEIESENYNIAKSFIQKAISIDSNRADFFALLGSVNQFSGDTQAAEFSYLEAINLNSRIDAIWNLLIDYYFFTDNFKKAIETTFEAIKNVGESYVFSVKISVAYFDMEEFDKGLQYLKQALNRDNQAVDFFLEYYPEGKENAGIMNLIKQFPSK